MIGIVAELFGLQGSVPDIQLPQEFAFRSEVCAT
jgi:hypothetical protein